MKNASCRILSLLMLILPFHTSVNAQLSDLHNQIPAPMPKLELETQYGNIVIQLDTVNAPITAKNFLAYVKGGHFSKLSFYRTVNPVNDNQELTVSVLQGGLNDDVNDNVVRIFEPITHESTEQTGLKHLRGAISMARGDLGTAQTEFFISLTDNPALDAGGFRHPDAQGFAVLGKVTSNMNVVDEIAALPATKKHPNPYVKNQFLSEPVLIDISSAAQ
jgi:peptidyl-prolyl cis-trans isomerase A (cyclophilin A)